MTNNHIKIRIKFEKYGAIRYIGHLDVMRFFQKCIRRADIDVCYTTGFSPHQIMSFAAPLSVGLESHGEYMDLEVNSLTTSDDMVKRLNEASVPGIRIISVKQLPDDAGNAMASVAAALYTVLFKDDRVPALFQSDPAMICRTIEHFLSLKEIPYEKEGKKGTRTIDLKQGIYELQYQPQSKSLRMLLDASSSGNIKPSQIIESILALNKETLSDNALIITREETYADRGDADHHIFVPLDEIGKTF